MTGSVLVVGGGIAGRATARVLARHGLACTLVEQRGSIGPGMGVNLPGNAVRALVALGVSDQVVPGGLPVRRREYRNRRGRLLFAVDEDRFWDGVGRPLCVRHRDLLVALSLPDAVTIETARVVGAHPTSEGVAVHLEAGRSPRHFDFVVGADGVHSTMRDAVATVGLRPSSMTGTAWRFVVENPGVDCWTAWSGHNTTFLLLPMADDLIYGYAARTRGGDTGADRSWMAQAAERFPTLVATAVGLALHAGELHHAAVDEVRLAHWYQGRLVLIGDAAHATGPVWAQGVAMALEDALVLGRLLASTPTHDWARVGPEYEALRRPRVSHVQSATDRMSRLVALPGWLRDLSAPVIGPRNYQNTYAPLRAVPIGSGI